MKPRQPAGSRMVPIPTARAQPFRAALADKDNQRDMIESRLFLVQKQAGFCTQACTILTPFN